MLGGRYIFILTMNKLKRNRGFNFIYTLANSKVYKVLLLFNDLYCNPINDVCRYPSEFYCQDDCQAYQSIGAPAISLECFKRKERERELLHLPQAICSKSDCKKKEQGKEFYPEFWGWEHIS